MRERVGSIVVAAVLASGLFGASGAAAATEVGNDCSGISAAPDITLLQLNKVGNWNLPIVVPAPGVLTQWKVQSALPDPNTERFKVFRPTGAVNEFQAIAESPFHAVLPGDNTFAARIPVQAGDRLGAYAAAPSGVLFCLGNPEDTVGHTNKDVPVGGSEAFAAAAGLQLALSAVIEPDVDGDGFGDETQDKCPRSAAIQDVECPLVQLSSQGLATKSSILVFASASSPAGVTVTGRVNVPRKTAGKKKGKGRASALVQLNGGTKSLAAGQVTRFAIKLPPRVRARLASLPRRRSLTARVTTTAPDVAGGLFATTIAVKLRGQKKPAKKR